MPMIATPLRTQFCRVDAHIGWGVLKNLRPPTKSRPFFGAAMRARTSRSWPLTTPSSHLGPQTYGADRARGLAALVIGVRQQPVGLYAVFDDAVHLLDRIAEGSAITPLLARGGQGTSGPRTYAPVLASTHENAERLDSSPAPARLATTPQILAGIVFIIVGQFFAGTDGPKRADEGPGPITRKVAVWLA